MNNYIEELKYQMHEQGRVAGHLWYMIKKYEQKQADINFTKDEIVFLGNRIVKLNAALEKCTIDSDKKFYIIEIKKAKNELEKARDRLVKKTAELEEFGDIENIKSNYEFENARLYKLMEEYKELIKNENYE